MRRRVIGIGLGVSIAVVLAVVAWLRTHRHERADVIVLAGNIDLRQVDLPFNNSDRIAEVLVQEGDHVRRGQVLARLDTQRLQPQLTQAAAEAAAQHAVVARLRRGSRPEEIAQAKANVAAARADSVNAQVQFQRLSGLGRLPYRAVSEQDVDNAKAALDIAEAKLVVQQRALDLAVAGPRREDVDQAEAQARSDDARLALVRQQFADAKLLAPTDAVIRARLMEPGELASPGRPVFSLAITDPKWVRAYVSEQQLGHVHPGMPAWIEVDSYPGRRFAGWVGFISPTAEFTPKSVETQELRTSLVYEVRVFVHDSTDALRLGMPATVLLSPGTARPGPAVEDRPRTAPVGRDSQ